MIRITHVVLPSPEQMKFVIEGMRNPMNSWEKSDSVICKYGLDCDSCKRRGEIIKCNEFYIGNKDRELMESLAKAGSDHRKFMRMMPAYVRVTAPLYWWKEFDTYKIATVGNSCSTMHKIQEKEFTLGDFSHEHLDGVSRDMFNQNDHDQPYFFCSFEDMLYIQVEALNRARNLYLETKDKKYWWQMIQLLPSSYNQTRNLMLNYEVLANIYRQRKHHKLDEWRNFCEWIENDIPWSDLITGLKTEERG